MDIWIIFKFANVQSVVEQIYPEISEQTSKHIFKLNWDTALVLSV